MTVKKPSKIKAISVGLAALGFLGIFFYPGSMLWVILLVLGLCGYFWLGGAAK